MRKFPVWCSDEQTKELNKLFGLERVWYNLEDVFNFLPGKIRYNNEIGYLKISKFDIVYSALETERNNSVVILFQYLLNNETIYDAFIKAIKFFTENKDKVEILEK